MKWRGRAEKGSGGGEALKSGDAHLVTASQFIGCNFRVSSATSGLSSELWAQPHTITPPSCFLLFLPHPQFNKQTYPKFYQIPFYFQTKPFLFLEIKFKIYLLLNQYSPQKKKKIMFKFESEFRAYIQYLNLIWNWKNYSFLIFTLKYFLYIRNLLDI